LFLFINVCSYRTLDIFLLSDVGDNERVFYSSISQVFFALELRRCSQFQSGDFLITLLQYVSYDISDGSLFIDIRVSSNLSFIKLSFINLIILTQEIPGGAFLRFSINYLRSKEKNRFR
jgi:hypothetical protein